MSSLLLAAVAGACAPGGAAWAVNGTWNNAVSGTWNDTTKWASATVANGSGATADFSTLNLTSDLTVHLDTTRTLGVLLFGDTTPSNNWTLDNNGVTATVMLLAGGNQAVTVNNQTATINLNLQGSGVAKNGVGTLVLNGSVDNTGLGMIANAGTLVLGKTSGSVVHAIGGGGLTVAGGLVQLGGSNNDQIYDPANVSVNSGTFDTVGMSETFTGLVLQGNGIAGGGALTNSNPFGGSTITPTSGTVLAGNTTIGVPFGTSFIQLNNAISGNFALTKVGSGTLDLNGTNTFSGGLNVQNGALQINTINNASSNGALGNNSSVTLGASGQNALIVYNGPSASTNMPFVLATGGTGGFYVTSVGLNLTLNGVISGSGGFVASIGIVTLGASNTFTGGVTINSSATLQLANTGALNTTSPNAVTMNGGTLTLGGNSVTVNGLSSASSAAVVQNASAIAATLTVNNSGSNAYAGVLTNGSGSAALSLTKAGIGSLDLTNFNSYTGGTTLNDGGSVLLGNDAALGTGAVTVNSGIIASDGAARTLANNITLNGTLGVSGNLDLTLNGVISGAGGLFKGNDGTAHLTNTNTFSGGVTLTNGSILIQNGSALGTGTFTADAIFGSVTFGAEGTAHVIPNDVSITNGSTLIIGGSQDLGVNGVISGAGGIQKTGATTLYLYKNNTFTGALTILAGTGQTAGLACDVYVEPGATWIYTGGPFGGRLFNFATFQFGSGVSMLEAGRGVENDNSLTVAAGQSIVADTLGIDNEGTINLTGGILQSNAQAIVNNGLISGNGQLGGSGAFTNNGTLTLGSGGSLILSNAGPISNAGTINVAAGTQLKLTGASLANTGTINLTGGLIPAGSTINNNAGGLIAGSGSIATTVANNSGGTLLAQGGTMNLGAALSNAGTILLNGPAATLTGAAITNNGILRGDGTVANALTNTAAGEIRAENGKNLSISNMTAANAGKITLQGGSADFTAALINAAGGTLSGSGSLHANAGITNNGQIQLSAGNSGVYGAVTSGSGSKIIVSGGGVASFYSPLTMSSGSEFRVSTASTAVFFANVSGTSNFTGTGTRDFEAGSSSLMALVSGGNDIVATGASLTSTVLRENSLTVSGGTTTLQPDGSNAATSTLNALSITGGGKLDLTNNKLIVASGDAGSWNGSSYTGITGLIASGRNGGSWSGSGIVTSSANGNFTSLGIATAQQAGRAGGTFGGIPVAGSDVLLMYTYGGDANLDGKINVDDYGRIDFNVNLGTSGWFNGDFNYDGKINVDDYGIIDFNVGIQGAAFSTGAAVPGVTAVPEPEVRDFAVIGTVCLAMTKRRRRHALMIFNPMNASAPQGP